MENLMLAAPASAGATSCAVAEATVDLLSEYLLDLINRKYAIRTVMERMKHLHEWRAFGMTDDLDELYCFLDQYAAREERLRRFVAVRAYTRWLFERGQIPSEWTAQADLGRVAGL